MYAESANLKDYIKRTVEIDYDHKLIINKCSECKRMAKDDIELIKVVYEFVRDKISHSGDIGEQTVSCKASEVIENGHGICCAKSHLLAAMLRFFDIPTGFCYQKLCSDDVDQKVLHGLNAVYLKELGEWIRLDARGNKEGIDAQFDLTEEKIAWPVNKELGEEDNPIIYVEPNRKVVELLEKSNDRKELSTHWEIALQDLFT